MTSDFTRLAQSLHRELGAEALYELCWSLLSLTRGRAPWLRERWRSYLTHLCAIPCAHPSAPPSPDPTPAHLTTLLAQLLLITPREQRPSQEELDGWLSQRHASICVTTLMEYVEQLEGSLLSEWTK